MSAVNLAYDLSGPEGAPAILLLNSLGSTRAMWDANVPVLQQNFRVVRCDSRGHGESPVPNGPYDISDFVDDAVALLDRLELRKAAIVGLSLGGMTGLALAARHPDRVTHLVAMCTAAYGDFGSIYGERAALVRDQGMAPIAQAVVQRWFTPDYLVADLSRQESWVGMVQSTPPEGYAAACETIAALDLRAELGRISLPTLVIGGKDDVALPPKHQERIAQAVPGAMLMLIDQAAHLANAEQPQQVSSAIVDFLEKS